MKVKLLRPWSYWSTGHVFTEMTGAQAAALVNNGTAEYVAEAQAMASPLNRMLGRASLHRDSVINNAKRGVRK